MKRRVRISIVTTDKHLELVVRQMKIRRSTFAKMDRQSEGVSWAYGWSTKAADALRVSVALGAGSNGLRAGWSSHTYAFQVGP